MVNKMSKEVVAPSNIERHFTTYLERLSVKSVSCVVVCCKLAVEPDGANRANVAHDLLCFRSEF